MTPGAAFRQLRLAAGIPQNVVARRLKVTPTMVFNVESGRRPVPATFRALAASLTELALLRTCKAVQVLAAEAQRGAR